MAIYLPSGYYLAKLRWRCDGDAEEVISTMVVSATDAGGDQGTQYPDGAAKVAEKVAKSWIAGWPAARLMTGWTMHGCEAYHTASGDSGEWPNLVPGSNSDSGDQVVPINVALLVKKKTGEAGRRNRGRMYLPAGYMWPAAFSRAGLLTSVALSTFGAAMDTFQSHLEEENEDGPPLWAYVAHHQAEGAAPRAPTLITDFIVDAKIATQRGRLR